MTQQTNDNIRFLRGLRAVRDYTSDPIPDDVLNSILEVGRWSGSASNVQGTEVVVVRDRAILQRMSEVGARPAAGAAAALVIVMPGDESRRDLDSFDNGRLVERLLLAAKAVGVGSNIATLKEDGPDVIKEALGIPRREAHLDRRHPRLHRRSRPQSPPQEPNRRPQARRTPSSTTTATSGSQTEAVSPPFRFPLSEIGEGVRGEVSPGAPIPKSDHAAPDGPPYTRGYR